MLGVIAIFIALRYLIDPLGQKLKQRMISAARGARVLGPGGSSLEKFESFICLPHEEVIDIDSKEWQ